MTTDVHPLDPNGPLPQVDIARLRSAGPAARVELPGGVVAWSVTRYDVLRRLTEDDRISRDARQHWPGFATVPQDWPLAPFLIAPTVLNAHAADHRRLRAVMEAAFAPERLEELAANLGKRLPELLAELGDPGSGRVVDLRAGFAAVVAADTLCDLFGVPHGQWADARKAMSDLLSPAGDATAAAAQLDSALRFFGGLVESKRTAPAADMASTVAHDATMTGEERVLALAVTVAGGLPSTTDLIANAVADLLGHPDQLAAVLAGTVPWTEVVEETLRFDAPVQHMPLRYAVEDVDLGDGVVIRRGDAVLMGFGTSGRDPRLHGDTAGTFDVHRIDKAHVALGHGIHHCIGAALGRGQAAQALAALFEHFPGLRPAEDLDALEPLPTFIFNGRTRVPVHL